jgi:hypothetical protein
MANSGRWLGIFCPNIAILPIYGYVLRAMTISGKIFYDSYAQVYLAPAAIEQGQQMAKAQANLR